MYNGSAIEWAGAEGTGTEELGTEGRGGAGRDEIIFYNMDAISIVKPSAHFN